MNKYEDVSLRRRIQINFSGNNTFADEVLPLSSFRNGTENIKFKQIILNGGDATTALSAARSVGYYKPSVVRFKQSWPVNPDGIDTTGGIFFSAIANTNIAKDLQAEAVAKANSKYFSTLSDLRLSVASGQEFLGEIRETVNFLRSPFKNGVGLLTNFFTILSKNPAARKKFLRTPAMKANPNSIFYRKPGKNGALQTSVFQNNGVLCVQDLGSQWLEVRFGLLPLIKELANLSNIATTTARQERKSSHRAFARVEAAVPDEFKEFSRVLGIKHRYTIKREAKAECSIRFGYLEKALTALEVRNAMVQETFLNLSSLPGTAWNLLPMTCFLDYFVNISEIINSVFESQANVCWISKSIILTDSVDYQETSCTCNVSNQTSRNIEALCNVGWTTRKVNRSTGPVGISPMYFSLPSSPIRLGNIAAFLTSFLRK